MRRFCFFCLFRISVSIIVDAILFSMERLIFIAIFGFANVGISLFLLHVVKNLMSHLIFFSFVRFFSIFLASFVAACPYFSDINSNMFLRAYNLIKKFKTRSLYILFKFNISTDIHQSSSGTKIKPLCRRNLYSDV